MADPNSHDDLNDYPCPDCGDEGPHPYWPDDQVAECAKCLIEFPVSADKE